MSKNYKGIHYIQEQLKDFDKSFVNCVIRCFNLIEENKEPDGCLSNTTALYICAKSCGYNPIICYGLVCKYMNKTLTKELFWQLRSYAENVQL